MTVIENYLQLDGSSRDILVFQIPNEILNGFVLDNFDRVVGVSRDEFKLMVIALRAATIGASISAAQALVFRNALVVAMRHGIVTANHCSKLVVSPIPGQLIVVVRKRSFMEGMRS